jgi:hypothetical protein
MFSTNPTCNLIVLGFHTVQFGQTSNPYQSYLDLGNYKKKQSSAAIVIPNNISKGTKLSLARSLRKLKEKIADATLSLNIGIIDSIDDALKFLSILPQDDSNGFISISEEDSEVILRWYNGNQWVNVYFDGTHEYEYAYMQDDKFVGGKEVGNLTKFSMPADLECYLVSLFCDAV